MKYAISYWNNYAWLPLIWILPNNHEVAPVYEEIELGSFCCCGIHLWRMELTESVTVIANVDNGWGECIILIRGEIYSWNVRFGSCLILSYFIDYPIYSLL